MSKCEILPISGFQSTNLNSKIDTFERLGDRILRSLGYPFTNVEIHRDQLFENISIAVEFFTKFAGYTQEYLIFDSRIYKKNYGIKLDELFTLSQTETFKNQLDLKTQTPDFSKQIDVKADTYVVLDNISSSLFTSISSLSSSLVDGLSANQLINREFYNEIITFVPSVSSSFQLQTKKTITVKGKKSDADLYINSFDYDTLDYRKVIDVTNFEEGSTTGINTLFTIEQTLAQQTYFSYAMGNYGFDLISWYTLKNWLETREKLLSLRRSYKFDDRNQILTMYPQPRSSNSNVDFYGVLSCYVEKPIRHVISELWVYHYALALTKIVVGRVRKKYMGTSLFGGGTLDDTMLQEGIEEKNNLETQMFEGTAGYGDAEPPMFFVG